MKQSKFSALSILLIAFFSFLFLDAYGQWATSGSNIYNTNSGNVGIGTSSPTYYKLQVNGSLRVENAIVMGGSSGFLVDAPGIPGGRFIVNGTGDVGIGINNPSARLHTIANTNTFETKIAQFQRVGNGASGNGIFMTHGAYTLNYNGLTATGDAGIFFDNDNNAIADAASGLVIGPWSNKPTGIKIMESGNVGIGTAYPSTRLDVNGQIKITGGNPGSGKILTSDANGLATWTTPTFSSQWTTNNNDITYTNGNIGIGTATPDKGRLHVKGSVHVENSAGTQIFHVSSSKQLVFVGDSAWIQYNASLNNPNSLIQQNNFAMWVSKGIVSQDYAVANVSDWDDYVFNENYELPSLEKVAAFIKANKHLPNIPSEATVKQHGYSVHQLNRGFLKTIEEMTLYALEQAQKIKEQGKKIEALETKVTEYEHLAEEVKQLKAMIAELKK